MAATNPASKTLILGLIAGMSLDQIRPFFLSLNKAGYRGELCMLVCQIDASVTEFLQTRNVRLVPVQIPRPKTTTLKVAKWLRPFLSRRQQLRVNEALALRFAHLHCARHFYYRRFLLQHGTRYEHIMLSDVRDVLFQCDPFDFDLPEGLSVFLEDAAKTIGACPYNSTWMRNGFGDAVLRELYHLPIACAGTTLGTTTAVLDLLNRTVPIFTTYQKTDSIDQATYNFVIHKHPPNPLHRFDNDSGPILTMAHVNPTHWRFDKSGFLLNPLGHPYHVLHQYDRHPELARRLLATLT